MSLASPRAVITGLVLGFVGLLLLCGFAFTLGRSSTFDFRSSFTQAGSTPSSLSTPPASEPTEADPTEPGVSESPPELITIPDLTGVRLPEAEQTLWSLGFFDISTEDATGQDRIVINPNNWVVRSQDPPPGTAVPRDAEITLWVARPTDNATTPEVTEGVIPNVVCMDLQAAQDVLRDAGFYRLRSVDGTGQGRQQWIDRNWVVIAQSEPPGSRPDPTTEIVLTVVAFGEPTGDSGCAS